MTEGEIRILKAEIERLKKILITDELTGVYNRRGLMELLPPMVKEVGYSLRHPDKRKKLVINGLTLIFTDIDHFKNINDTYGHPDGDKALKIFARTLKKAVRGIDIVSRYGGEEFVIGLIGASIEDGRMVAENLRQRVTQIEVESADGKKFCFTASFGVAELKTGMNLEDLLSASDKALYEAKNTGRNKVVAAK